MKHVGNIAGPLLAFEVLTAFFLEATFLEVRKELRFGQCCGSVARHGGV